MHREAHLLAEARLQRLRGARRALCPDLAESVGHRMHALALRTGPRVQARARGERRRELAHRLVMERAAGGRLEAVTARGGGAEGGAPAGVLAAGVLAASVASAVTILFFHSCLLIMVR